jgi:hypothetical protein
MSGLCDYGSITFASDWSGHAASVAAPLHKWRSSPRSASPAHARLTHRQSRAPCFVGSESHDRDRDVTRDDRAGRTGDVGGRELCGDVPIRAAVAEAVPSPAGAGRAMRSRDQGDSGRLSFRSGSRAAPRDHPSIGSPSALLLGKQPCPTATRHSSAAPPSA